MKCIRELYGSGEVIVPPLTWISDIVATIESGFKPVFVDIKKNNLSLDEDLILKKYQKNKSCLYYSCSGI